MKFYNIEIVQLLNNYFSQNEQYVESIMLASYGFNIQFVDFKIQCNERVFASVNGESLVWEEAPSSYPWGALGRQLAKNATLESNSILKIVFDSGDSLSIETCEHQYESVIFDFGSSNGSLYLEIF